MDSEESGSDDSDDDSSVASEDKKPPYNLRKWTEELPLMKELGDTIVGSIKEYNELF